VSQHSGEVEDKKQWGTLTTQTTKWFQKNLQLIYRKTVMAKHLRKVGVMREKSVVK
jgi:hypothetical protein